MQFKQLIIHGFKSFVDKTSIDFPNGIVCVVGPNGSGKSNVLDAIRWVLGEQNPKELRGSDMDDIIFAGSDSRKSSGFAEVTLILKEIDETLSAKWGSISEMSITRKYYRDGEREYFINNKKCKLKDIREVFYDTGLGARSISIIEQGKVEKIIQSSPEDLRVFFDETAGVMKFKERKKESEKRLQQSKENLARVNDIIAEIKGSLGQLGHQKEKLEKYKDIRNRKNELEKIYYSNNYELVLNNIESCKSSIEFAKLELTEKISIFQDLRKKEDKWKSEKAAFEEYFKRVSNEAVKLTERFGEVKSSISILENNIKSAEQTKISTENEIISLKERLKELTERKRDLDEEKSANSSSCLSIKENIKELEEILEEYNNQYESISEEIRDYEGDYVEIIETLADMKNKKVKIESEQYRLQRDRDRLEKDIAEFNADIDKNKVIFAEMESNLLSVSTRHKELAEYSQEIKDKLSIGIKSVSELDKEINRLKININSFVAKSSMLRNQINLETYGGEKEISFFEKMNSQLYQDYSSRVDKEITFPLGDVIVINKGKDGDIFAEMAKLKGGYKFIFSSDIMTLEDELISREYTEINDKIIRYDGIYHKIGEDDRIKKINELKKQLLETEEHLSRDKENLIAAENNRQLLSSENSLIETELEECRQELSTIDKTISELTSKKNQINSELMRAQNRLQIIEKETKLNSVEFENTKEQLEHINLKIDELKSSSEDKEEVIDELKDKLEFYSSKIDGEKETISEERIKLSSFLEKENSINKEISYIEKELNLSMGKISHLSDKLNRLTTVDIKTWNQNLVNNRVELDKLEKDKILNSEVKRNIEADISDISESLEKVNRDIDRQQREIREVEDKMKQWELKSAQLISDRDHIAETYIEKFNDSIEMNYKDKISSDFSPKKIKNEITGLESEIDNIGPVNMAADAEYNELHERYVFLTKQRDDLENAVMTIIEIIDEIDDKTVIQFKTTFDSVRGHFLEIFKILFGDGKADLKLTEPDNLLNTGVDIFVQPPGKKLQNMSLLSGGEKAMSACALLFAMFLHKPTPFCFLDEIDAPLDDANIGRFINIVKELSKNVQFMIITHNQKTMENADYLYGVTMQDAGISKIISVRMNNRIN